MVWPGKQSETPQTESPLCYGSRWQLMRAVPLLRHPSPGSEPDLPCLNQWPGCCQQPAHAIEKRKGLPSACCLCRKTQILVLSPSKTHTDAHTSWARLRHMSAMPSVSKRFSKHHVQNPAPFPGIVNSPSLQSNVLPLIPLTKCQYNQTQKSIQKITYIQIFLQLKELYLWQHTLHLTCAINIQAVFWSCILIPRKTTYSLVCCKHISMTEELKSLLVAINLDWPHNQALVDACSILHSSYQRHGLPKTRHHLCRRNQILFSLDQTTHGPK